MKKINYVNAALDDDFTTAWIPLNEGNRTIINGSIIVLLTGLDGVIAGTLNTYISNDNEDKSGILYDTQTITADPYELFISITTPIQYIKFEILLGTITLIDALEIDGIFSQEVD